MNLQIRQEDGGIIVGDVELETYITNYYKGLFGPPKEDGFRTVENRNQNIPLHQRRK